MKATAEIPTLVQDSGALALPGARGALGGFFVSGVLLAFLGAILPSWGHHVQSDYWMIGLYFLALIAGVLSAVRTAPQWMAKKGLGWTLTSACALAAGALLYLAFFSPPFAAWWRLPGVLLVGMAAGVLHTAIFHAISPIYRHDPAATVNLAGILFGLGCFAVALLISRMFYTYTASAIQVWIALIPAFFAVGYARVRFIPQALAQPPTTHALIEELKSPNALLLSLILFFQLGNEWAIAGWLPLFLSQRLGMSPSAAIMMLAFYWLALLVGRVVAQWILPRFRHARLLTTCVLLSMFACVILLATDNSFGAATGVLLLGGALAPIYPLVVEKIGAIFPSYHPGFYNGIFSLAMAGGLLAPCALGYLAWVLDVRAVMAVPLMGSAAVAILLIALWLQGRLRSYLQP